MDPTAAATKVGYDLIERYGVSYLGWILAAVLLWLLVRLVYVVIGIVKENSIAMTKLSERIESRRDG